jgi:hypothetical protein
MTWIVDLKSLLQTKLGLIMHTYKEERSRLVALGSQI